MTVENLSRRQLLRGKLLTSLQSKSEQTEDFAPIRPPWSVTNEEFIFVENVSISVNSRFFVLKRKRLGHTRSAFQPDVLLSTALNVVPAKIVVPKTPFVFVYN